MKSNKKRIEVTSDDFAYMVRSNALLVDKTLMIKDFLKGQQVSLITRPRRSGKSLNISMLHNFLAADIGGDPTTGLFDEFAIAKEDNGMWMQQHQGQYPVISMTLKDVKEMSYSATMDRMRDLIKKLYREHLSQRSLMTEASYNHLFDQYLNGLTDDTSLESSLSFLTEFLHKTHGKKVMVLIDEYDTPLTNAYQHGFLDDISFFMRNMFSATLKSNRSLEKGLITGILKVSKNELLSGLNNLKIYSLFDTTYSQYFGFTEEEVITLIQKVGAIDGIEKIKQFYNGYIIGKTVIYNPWSLMNYLSEKQLGPYWVLTSGDKLLKDLFLNSRAEQKDQFSELMKGNTITATISLQTRYEELMEDADALWTLLLFAGYLTPFNYRQQENDMICQLKIPNDEILSQYRSIFSEWLRKGLGGYTRYQAFLTHLLNGEIETFTTMLADYLLDSLSFRDSSEYFYHGFVAGLVASIRETHWVDSNKESGYGLYDIMLTPKANAGTRAIILEFKHVKKSEFLEEAAKQGLLQIDKSAYTTVLARHTHITHVIKVGLAFSGKAVQAVYRETNMMTHEHGELIWVKQLER